MSVLGRATANPDPYQADMLMTFPIQNYRPILKRLAKDPRQTVSIPYHDQPFARTSSSHPTHRVDRDPISSSSHLQLATIPQQETADIKKRIETKGNGI